MISIRIDGDSVEDEGSVDDMRIGGGKTFDVKVSRPRARLNCEPIDSSTLNQLIDYPIFRSMIPISTLIN